MSIDYGRWPRHNLVTQTHVGSDSRHEKTTCRDATFGVDTRSKVRQEELFRASTF
jgi:hypothetical protein